MRRVCACTNLKCSTIGWWVEPSLPVTLTPSLRVVTAANAMPVSITCFSTPSRPQRKSRCHQERRNSPSVTAWRPTSSCFLMTRSISRSSTAVNSAAVISPLARFSRATLSAAGRSRLPTWSARNGGLVRCIGWLSSAFSSAALSVFPFVPAQAGTQLFWNSVRQGLGPRFRGDERRGSALGRRWRRVYSAAASAAALRASTKSYRTS